MEELTSRPAQLGEVILSGEQLAEVVRLQRGIAVLDLFSKEEDTENRREAFLGKTQPGSETRAEILDGPAYKGNEAKLGTAIKKAERHFAVHDIRRRAMLEHASFLSIPAAIKGKKVTTDNPQDMERLALEHGKWRSNFALRNRRQERAMYRDFLEAKTRLITGEPKTEPASITVGPSVNLQERAVLLTRAANAMARRSMLSGLGIAIPDDQYNEPVYERYQEGTPHLDLASRKKVDRLLDAAKRDFWHASGFPVIRSSGSMSELLLRRRAQKMWKEFAGQFEHSPQQAQRVKFRKQLRAHIPEERLADTAIDTI